MIAYFLLVHRFPRQFKQLFRAIYDPANTYLVHVDETSGPQLAADIRRFLAPYQGADMLESKPALWGGYSLVDAELRGMAKLLEMGSDWEYFINLSGQDFPLKPQSAIKSFLAAQRGKEFIRVSDQQRTRPDTMSRVEEFVTERRGGIERSGQVRPFLEGVTPFIGNQWKVVSRRFCEFACHDPSVARFKAFYRNTFIADEGFFQTLMKNTDGHGEIVSDDLRMIDWVPDGDIKLRPRTFTMADRHALATSPALFARKFDAEVDGKILDVLEARVGQPIRPTPPVVPALVLAAA